MIPYSLGMESLVKPAILVLILKKFVPNILYKHTVKGVSQRVSDEKHL